MRAIETFAVLCELCGASSCNEKSQGADTAPQVSHSAELATSESGQMSTGGVTGEPAGGLDTAASSNTAAASATVAASSTVSSVEPTNSTAPESDAATTTETATPSYSSAAETTAAPAVTAPAVALSEYTRQAAPIELGGIDGNASGITWKPETDTFFIVANTVHLLYEYDAKFGTLLRTISLDNGPTDTEDVVYLGQNRFGVVVEDNEVYVVTIEDGRDDDRSLSRHGRALRGE